MSPERVRSIRLNYGWTQEEFARELGFATKSAVSQLETGHRVPDGPLLKLLEILEKNSKKSNS